MVDTAKIEIPEVPKPVYFELSKCKYLNPIYSMNARPSDLNQQLDPVTTWQLDPARDLTWQFDPVT